MAIDGQDKVKQEIEVTDTRFVKWSYCIKCGQRYRGEDRGRDTFVWQQVAPLQCRQCNYGQDCEIIAD